MLKALEWTAQVSAIVFVAAIIGLVIAYSSQQSGNTTGLQQLEKYEDEQRHSMQEKGFWQRVVEDPIATFTLLLVILTASLGIFQLRSLTRAEIISAKAYESAKVSADAAQKAASVAERTMIASQRAWVSLKARIESPLVFDENGASTAIAFEVTNIGATPASNVSPHVWLIAVKSGGPFPMQEQKRRCDAIRKLPVGGGVSLFPGDQFPSKMGIGSVSWGVNVPPGEVAEGLLISGDKRHLLLFAVGCVDYAFATDPDRHHQTGFIFELQRKNRILQIGPDDGKIEATDLDLIENVAAFGVQAD